MRIEFLHYERMYNIWRGRTLYGVASTLEEARAVLAGVGVPGGSRDTTREGD